MNVLGIIPARYGSTRLEGKPLADIEGKPMIQWVYENASQAIDKIVVATDDKRIFDAIKKFGGRVVMTSKEHNTGTNRCLEALEIISKEDGYQPDVVINVQGDEPLLKPDQIKTLINCFNDKDTELATLVIPATNEDDLDYKNGCFVVFDTNNNALYFSRTAIPFIHGVPQNKWLDYHTFYKHLGMYGYTPQALKDFASMERTSLEKAESLEQNRWLQNGRKIKVGLTYFDSVSVDTIEDLEKVREIVKRG